MKNSIKSIVAASLLGFAATVQAIPITGTVDMNGTAILNSTSLAGATAINSITNAQVGGLPTGSFAGVAVNTSVTWSGFSFPSAATVAPLWSFTDGVRIYSFDLHNVNIVSQDNNFLNLSGFGELNITGGGPTYDTTVGTWSFTISNAGGQDHANFAFTFANSQTATVPDGGTTMMLLGAGLSGLGLLRKKLVA